jgi:hypothetical protein
MTIQEKDGSFINIGNMHKNSKDNLIVLCKGCHTTLHSNKLELESINTSSGKIVRMKPETPKLNHLTLVASN